MEILDYRTINLNRINFSDPIKVKGNCLLTKSSYNYNNTQIPIYIQTPKMTSTNGLIINDTRSYIELEINRNHVSFYDFINKLDEHNINITYNNSEDWFEQKLPMDVIDDFYNSPIKMTKMNTFPTIKFKVPIYKNKKGCDIFSDTGNPIDPQSIKKNTDVICILELGGIKYYKHRFECEWNVTQIKAFTNDNVVRECMVREELLSDNEEDHTDFSIEQKKNKNEDVETVDIELDNNQEECIKEVLEENNVENIEINVENNVEEEENIENNVEEVLEENIENNEEEESEDIIDELEGLEEIELENDSKDIETLMNEINLLKKRAMEKDEEVNNLKNKYKNLYQELNL